MKPEFSTLDGRFAASDPARVRVNALRWIRCYPFWPLVLGSGFCLSLVLLTVSWWFLIMAGLLLVIQAAYWRRITEHFRQGDRNPGLVLQTNPLRIATATDMSTGTGCLPVLKVVQHGFRLRGSGAVGDGDIVATVSLYHGDGTAFPRHWIDFDPIPLRCATGDPDVIASETSGFSEEAIGQLRLLVERSRTLEPGLYWFDPNTLEPSDGPPK